MHSGGFSQRAGGWIAAPSLVPFALIVVFALFAALSGTGCSEDPPTSGGNLPPRIVSVNVSPSSVVLSGDARVTALVSDPDGDALTISWTATGGHFVDSTKAITTWRAPATPGLYFLAINVFDGQESTTDSVDVLAGNVAITVLSDPPGAFITLDGTPTGITTPRTFNPLASGFHTVSLFSQYFRYKSHAGRELVHGEHDTLLFVVDNPTPVDLSPGRTDLLEIGGVAMLPTGLGVIYVGRTATETALFSTPLFPSVNTPRGVRLVGGVRMEEPIAVGVTGPDLFFVTAGESLAVVAIRDKNQDGAVDSVGTVRRLRRGFAPAVTRDGSTLNERLAFGTLESELPPTSQILWALYSEGALSGLDLATPNAGKLATWKPGDDEIAYVRGNAIFWSAFSSGNLPQADTLYAGGVNTSPAWGTWAARMLVFLHGEDPGIFTDLMLTTHGAPGATTVYTALTDPRFVTWSTLERAVLISHHGGGTPRILILRNMPVP